ncbi:PR domain zinc finger protein 1 [Orchesella cincta]|uniref:PR domain zinc finger protein 1 n=1 Tax=Orchesella cincta TaxID=48709 RepID=A0A1D2M2R4_ORCCI|nr:PR domain zinc finger protein 1 [Orchesella cincta]
MRSSCDWSSSRSWKEKTSVANTFGEFTVTEKLVCYLDAFSTCRSNWMRYLNPAFSSDTQNLIACQYKIYIFLQIYFYTVKPILPNEELLVWHCREFAERLQYPSTGELMLAKLQEAESQSQP